MGHLTDRFIERFTDFGKILLFLIAVRAVMFIFGLDYGTFPIIDQIVYFIFGLCRSIAEWIIGMTSYKML